MFRLATTTLVKRNRFSSTNATPTRGLSLLLSRQAKFSYDYGSGGYNGQRHFWDPRTGLLLFGPAALILGINTQPVLAEDASNRSSSEDDNFEANTAGLRKIEDGSIISNEHTIKWRIFTNTGRDLFRQGKLDDAEKLFLSASQEAKNGFGEKDPHVAAALNNLAELYRVRREFDKAEPLYLEAVNLLEESFGPEDVRVGAALHNLGQFYLGQRNLGKACSCYERALKIKGRVLGFDNPDYADTMHHLGIVLHLLGNENDSRGLIQNSIRILEDAGEGESITCIRRLHFLAQIYSKSHRLADAENVQRKILHIVELSKGWNSMDTVVAAEELALTLRTTGSLSESKELLEHCLDAQKAFLSKDNIQVGANMLNLALVEILHSKQLGEKDSSEAHAKLDKAKDLLSNSISIARGVLDKFVEQKGSVQNYAASGAAGKDAHVALIVLMQSFDALGRLETTRLDFQRKTHPSVEAEIALRQCMSAFTEFGVGSSLSDSPRVKGEYLTCLKRLLSLMIDSKPNKERQELEDEIKSIEAQLSSNSGQPPYL